MTSRRSNAAASSTSAPHRTSPLGTSSSPLITNRNRNRTRTASSDAGAGAGGASAVSSVSFQGLTATTTTPTPRSRSRFGGSSGSSSPSPPSASAYYSPGLSPAGVAGSARSNGISNASSNADGISPMTPCSPNAGMMSTPRRRGGGGSGRSSSNEGGTSTPSYNPLMEQWQDATYGLEVPSLIHREVAGGGGGDANGKGNDHSGNFNLNGENGTNGNGNGTVKHNDENGATYLSFGGAHRSFDDDGHNIISGAHSVGTCGSGGSGSAVTGGSGGHQHGHNGAHNGSSGGGSGGGCASSVTPAAKVCSRKRTRRRAMACLAVIGLIGAQYVYAIQVAGQRGRGGAGGGDTDDAIMTAGSTIASVVSGAVNELLVSGGGKSLAEMLGVGIGGAAASDSATDTDSEGSDDDDFGDSRNRDGHSAIRDTKDLRKATNDNADVADRRRQSRKKVERREKIGHSPRVVYVQGDTRNRRKKGAKERKNQPSTRGGNYRSPPLIDLVRSIGRHEVSPGKKGNATNPYRGRKMEPFPADQTDETQLYPEIDSSDYPYNETMLVRSFPPRKGDHFIGNEKDVGIGCHPMASWQKTFHPTCNEFHGIDARAAIHDRLSYLGSGSWRDAWSLLPHAASLPHATAWIGSVNSTTHARETTGRLSQDSTVVYKTWSHNHRFEDFYYELNRIDAVAMERLTSSPYVIDIYGLCGTSIITQYATETLTTVADSLDMLEKLKLIGKIAKALSHVHGIDGGRHASLAHNDLNTAHILMARDGKTPLLNDFNVAQLLLRDDSEKPCGFASEHWSPQWRAPEEMQSFLGLDHEALSERVDIYALGNVIYRFLAGQRAWRLGPGSMTDEYQSDIAKLKMKKGRTPPVPESVLEQKDDMAVATLLDIMERCFKYKPSERPTARDIMESIDKALSEIEGVGSGSVMGIAD